MGETLRRSAEYCKKADTCTGEMVKAMDLLCEASEELAQNAEDALQLSQGTSVRERVKWGK